MEKTSRTRTSLLMVTVMDVVYVRRVMARAATRRGAMNWVLVKRWCAEEEDLSRTTHSESLLLLLLLLGEEGESVAGRNMDLANWATDCRWREEGEGGQWEGCAVA